MLKRGAITLLTVAVASGLVVIYQRFRAQAKKREREVMGYIEKGNRSMKEKAYSEAILFYLKCLSLLNEDNEELVGVYNNLAICLVKIKAHKEALIYVDKSLAINILNNEKALRWRYECHKSLEMTRETLCDAFLCGLVTKEEKYRKLAQDILKSEAENEARKRAGLGGGVPSNINYENFFSTFPDLFDDEVFAKSHLVKLILNKEYDKALSRTESKGDPLSVFVSAALNHVKGKDMLAISLLEHEKMVFSICLREYLKSLHGQAVMDMDDFVEKNSSNVSILFYVSKTYFNLKRFDLHEKFINLAIGVGEHDFLYVDKIACAAGCGKSSEVGRMLEEALEKYPDSISVLSLACEYYLKIEDFERLDVVLSGMEKKYSKDPRVFLFRGLLAQCRNDLDEAERCLKAAIGLDGRYFKPYIYLGGILLGKNDAGCREVYKKALEHAVTYDEIFAAEQALILLDVQDKIMEIYPDVLNSL